MARDSGLDAHLFLDGVGRASTTILGRNGLEGKLLLAADQAVLGGDIRALGGATHGLYYTMIHPVGRDA